MLILTTERLALLALDRELAALQAGSRTAFFNAIAVTHEAIWPPLPFESASFEWAARQQPAPDIVRMPDTGHFFHRRLMDLRGAIKNGVRKNLPPPRNVSA